MSDCKAEEIAINAERRLPTNRPFIPTLEEIKAECAKIRAGWTEDELRR